MNFLSLFKRSLIYRFKKKINIDKDGIKEKSLDDLFFHYGSDKSDIFKKLKDKGHGYSNFYTSHLKHLKHNEIKILEIGSFSGASAAAFKKFFFKSSIFCFDINISKFIYSSKNIHVYGLDVNNKRDLKKCLEIIRTKTHSNKFDVIVDDGSHNLSDLILSLKNLFEYVKSGGFYIIEDFKFPNYYEYNRNIDHIFMDEIFHNLNKKNFFKSSILKKEDQIYFHENISKISIHKGNLENSDICFIEKN